MKINQTIRQRRQALGLTQEQLAQQLGVSAQAVHKWESAASYPDITLLPPLARLLGVDLNTLLCFQDDLTPRQVAQFVDGLIPLLEEQGFPAAFQATSQTAKRKTTAAAVQNAPFKRRFPVSERAFTTDNRRRRTPSTPPFRSRR